MTAISDTAALAAIGAAARELKLPTGRDQAARLAEIAVRERQTHLSYLAEILSAEIDDRTGRRRTRRIAEARFPRIKRLADFNPDAIPGIAATLAALAAGAWIDAGQYAADRSDKGLGIGLTVVKGTPAPARPICSSAWAWPPASRAAGSATPPPPSWLTSSPKPPTSGSCPASSAARAASTCSCSTSSATSSSTLAAPNCSSRSSPNEKNEPPSPSARTCRSASGEPCSPTLASSLPSSTASPSTPTSSKPAPSPTGSPPARPAIASEPASFGVRV